MLYVQHSSASGRLDELWDFDAAKHRITAMVRLGAVPVMLVVHVCSPKKPRLGAHPIVRLDSESWRILPARYVRVWPHRIESLAPVPCPIGDELAPGQQLVLRNTPPHVDAELGAL